MRKTILMLGLLAAPAAAQETPQIFPTRDVTVTYRTFGTQGAPPSLTLAWQAGTRRLRMELPGMGWSVADHTRQTGFIVMEQMRGIMPMPPGMLRQQLSLPSTARFTKGGTATVAGLPCTKWRYRDGQDDGEACLTDDGVMLRAEGRMRGNQGGLEATTVRYGAVAAAQFEPPAGYQRLDFGLPR
jgi:hypothetical protein